MPRGYEHALYVQPFDQRHTFEAKMFGWTPPLSAAQTADIAEAKRVIYDGFKTAWWTSSSAPRSFAMPRPTA
jgi:hypothetical protein